MSVNVPVQSKPTSAQLQGICPEVHRDLKQIFKHSPERLLLSGIKSITTTGDQGNVKVPEVPSGTFIVGSFRSTYPR